MESVHYDEASDQLVEHIPELKQAYESELRWWKDERPGPHVIYGDILNPYIDRLLEVGDSDALRRVFSFLELLSTSEDVRVQEIVAVTVCEYLGGFPERLRLAKQFMGPATLRHSNDIERFWGPVR